jgi:hypothetical protein
MIDEAQFENRSNLTLCAERFGVAVRLASIHERDCEDGTASASGLAHQSERRRAMSGSAKPSSASTCAKVSTTVSAKRFSRYRYSDWYSHTDDRDEGAVLMVSQEYWGGRLLTVRYCTLHFARKDAAASLSRWNCSAKSSSGTGDGAHGNGRSGAASSR